MSRKAATLFTPLLTISVSTTFRCRISFSTGASRLFFNPDSPHADSDSSKSGADLPGVPLQAEQALHAVPLPAPHPPARSARQERGQRSAAQERDARSAQSRGGGRRRRRAERNGAREPAAGSPGAQEEGAEAREQGETPPPPPPRSPPPRPRSANQHVFCFFQRKSKILQNPGPLPSMHVPAESAGNPSGVVSTGKRRSLPPSAVN